MDDEIKFYVRHHYGKAFAYPVTHAEAIEQLTGCKTIRASDAEALRKMGFKLVQVIEPKPL